MVEIHGITISPPLVNTSCAWASDEKQLTELFDCPYTGAVTTRTATLGGFKEDSSHTVAFLKDSLSSLNSYGYSPHPLFNYVGPQGWVRRILKRSPDSTKPFIISITDSSPEDLRTMLNSIQGLRAFNPSWASRVAVEFNASCPNIKGHPPPSYDFPSLRPFLDVFSDFFWKDQTLTIGIKLPPYFAATQFVDVVNGIAAYSRPDSTSDRSINPFAFFTCTNTLGNSLVFADQTVDGSGDAGEFAVPPGVGGLAGEAIHSLSLGNVYSFSRLLAQSQDLALREIVIIGAGGVTSPEAVSRMHRAGAKVVGCATLLGKLGVAAFEHISRKTSAAS
ncbi:FMN-linked oxidoreductase [Paxillus ammoniavirescens]|nr:FMN-linked oxidoreductase [Paxillus ammoniavirescens]